MTARAKRDITHLVMDTELATRAMREGVAAEFRRKKKLGYPLYFWKDGDVVEVAPEDIPESGVFGEELGAG